jgi:hypothetical protein
VACVLLFGCQKESHNETVTTDATATASKNLKKGIANCRITRIVKHADPSRYDPENVAVFSYTNSGLLEKIKLDYAVSVNPGTEYRFLYDKHNRLVEFLGGYDPTNTEYGTRIKYQYNNRGLLVSDSSFQWGNLTHPYEDGSYSYAAGVSQYEYDNQGRVILVKSRPLTEWYGLPPSEVVYTHYTYDKNGNLNPGSNGTLHRREQAKAFHIYQTSPVLQFVYRDYSVYSLLKPSEVNQKNLPTKYNYVHTREDWDGPRDYILDDYDISNADIEYTCDNKIN